MPSVFIVNDRPFSMYHKMFARKGWEVVNDIKQADLIQFTGGEDVSPSLYGQHKHPATVANAARDLLEISIARWAAREKIPMTGICRGGQLLNVLSGGGLWQDVNNHRLHSHHMVYDEIEGYSYKASSIHHQMMRPTKDGLILATARCSTRREGMTPNGIPTIWENKEPFTDDVEAVVYWEPMVLCFQPHPERLNVPECTDAYFGYINDWIMG